MRETALVSLLYRGGDRDPETFRHTPKVAELSCSLNQCPRALPFLSVFYHRCSIYNTGYNYLVLLVGNGVRSRKF